MKIIQLNRNFVELELQDDLEAILLQNGRIKVRRIKQELEKVVTIKWGNHKKPRLYPGFTKIKGATWDGKKGAYALDEHGFPMVWIPVAILPQGLEIVNYDNSDFSKNGYHEVFPKWRRQQIIDDGGFFTPANPVSRNKCSGKLQLCEGELPLNNIRYSDAVIELRKLGTKKVGYRPIYGVEYDCICEWLKMIGYSMNDSTNWGNYANTRNREHGLALIGSREEARTRIGINDIAGTLWWITKEKNGSLRCAVRGGSFYSDGYGSPVGERTCVDAGLSRNDVGVWAVPFKR